MNAFLPGSKLNRQTSGYAYDLIVRRYRMLLASHDPRHCYYYYY